MDTHDAVQTHLYVITLEAANHHVNLPDWLACPEHLRGPVERAAWEFYAAKFYARGHLLPLHCSMLELLCQSYAMYRRACLDLEMASTTGEWRVLRDIVRTSWKEFREMLTQFNCSLNGALEGPIEVPPEGQSWKAEHAQSGRKRI